MLMDPKNGQRLSLDDLVQESKPSARHDKWKEKGREEEEEK